MLHTGMSIHIHKDATAVAGEGNWVSLDSEDGGHTVTIFVHNTEAAHSLIAALGTAIAHEEARRAKFAA